MKYLLVILVLIGLFLVSCTPKVIEVPTIITTTEIKYIDKLVIVEKVVTQNVTVEIPVIKYIEKLLPTFQQVKDFLLSDNTSRNTFVEYVYECRHFASDVNNNADKLGLKCAFVLLEYKTYQHALVAFETIDRGLIFIEPQTDARVYPTINGMYEKEIIQGIIICW